ncbi:uncharacterized protein LOC126839519 isoform X2 [Adelges cooleyi]|uniref:uncharacterized protein LOC126839519 isoform X2 n=1 Tax=Adelges cooleyi TaxID=133065 RepID=UPI00218014F4|nr:uncharacterized protein LOC126839519 isoform X2 [Adelges cooleyi]XP_050430823.1 uncharacterized protein LOC126839519 isoform X2 [Adelges cooleyi]
MKSFIQLFILFSIILAGLLVFSDGSCQIMRRPVKVDEDKDVWLQMPNFLMGTVETKLRDNNICIKGVHVCKIKHRDNRRRVVHMIFEQVAEEVTNMLDLFTGMVIQMIRLRENFISLEDLLSVIQLMVLRLNTCLEHLYDNGVNVTQALDRYLFLRDIMFVYQAEYETDKYGDDFQEKVLDLIKKKTNIEWLPVGGEDVPPKTYLGMMVEAKTKIISYTTFYNACFGCGWLNTDRLKWKTLMKSQSIWAVTVQHLVFSVNGKSLRQRYDETAAEVDSTKVIAFYAEVAETVTVLLAKKASDVIPLLFDYLLAMMDRGSPNDAIRHRRLNAAIVVLSELLHVLKSFESFMTTTLHLECPAQLLFNVIVGLDLVIKRGLDLLEKNVLERDLTRFMISVNPHFVKPVNSPDPAEEQLGITVVKTQTTEKLEKILKDMRAIILEISSICNEMRLE